MTEKSTFSQLKEQEKDKRRNIILEAAEEEFKSKPFHKVNMRDIAKKAGISPASIYRYFPDQQTLFLAGFSKGTETLLHDLEELNNESELSLDKITDKFIDYFSVNDHYYRVMVNFFLVGTVDSDVFEKLNFIEREMLDQFDRLFIKMKSKGNIRLLSHSYFAALTGVLTIFRGHPEKNEEEVLNHRKRIAGLITEIFKNGVDK